MQNESFKIIDFLCFRYTSSNAVPRNSDNGEKTIPRDKTTQQVTDYEMI